MIKQEWEERRWGLGVCLGFYSDWLLLLTAQVLMILYLVLAS